MLHQFEQHSICRRRMNKGDETATCAHARRFVNQARAPALQLRERPANVLDLNRNVMHAGTAFREKLSHRSVRTERLQQFDVRVANGKHANLYALFRHFFRRINLQSERIAPDGQTFFDALSGDADMINF
jgi:hypothetical protein